MTIIERVIGAETTDELNQMVEDFINKFQPVIPIDKYAMDDVCAQHPQYYSEVADWYSAVYGEFLRAKHLLKVKSAAFGKAVRKDPKKYDLASASVDAVKEVKESDKAISGLDYEVVELERLVGRLKGLIEAMDHRRSMINNEVDILMGRGPIASGMARTQQKQYERAIAKSPGRRARARRATSSEESKTEG